MRLHYGTITVQCPRCQSDHVYRHGKTPAGHARYRCPACPHVFQLSYTYEARKPSVKEQNCRHGLQRRWYPRHCQNLEHWHQYRTQGIKKLTPRQVTADKVVLDDVALICELDEQWSFVGSKVQRHWLWYAFDTKRRRVVAYTFGPRTDATCRRLLALLSPFKIGLITSDDWGSYAREVPAEKHLTGKIFTQRIERNNLTLRTRIKRLARKTICFSRSVDLHEKVIGAFIEKYPFN